MMRWIDAWTGVVFKLSTVDELEFAELEEFDDMLEAYNGDIAYVGCC